MSTVGDDSLSLDELGALFLTENSSSNNSIHLGWWEILQLEESDDIDEMVDPISIIALSLVGAVVAAEAADLIRVHYANKRLANGSSSSAIAAQQQRQRQRQLQLQQQQQGPPNQNQDDLSNAGKMKKKYKKLVVKLKRVLKKMRRKPNNNGGTQEGLGSGTNSNINGTVGCAACEEDPVTAAEIRAVLDEAKAVLPPDIYLSDVNCVVCADKMNDTVLDCGHLLCSNCASRVTTCPMCRHVIEAVYPFRVPPRTSNTNNMTNITNTTNNAVCNQQMYYNDPYNINPSGGQYTQFTELETMLMQP